MTAVGRKLNNGPITTETYIDFYDIVKQMFWDREGNNQASQKQSFSLYIDLYNLMLFHKYYKTTAKFYSTVGCYNISYMYIILGYGFLQNTYFKDYSYALLFLLLLQVRLLSFTAVAVTQRCIVLKLIHDYTV